MVICRGLSEKILEKSKTGNKKSFSVYTCFGHTKNFPNKDSTCDIECMFVFLSKIQCSV